MGNKKRLKNRFNIMAAVKERFLITIVGFIIVIFFLIVFAALFALSNYVHIIYGWVELSPVLLLVIAILCSTPLALAFVWERLTKIKVFEFEVLLAEVTSEVSQDLPDKLVDTNTLKLGTSLSPEMLKKIRSAVVSADESQVLEVYIGKGKTWLVTRLYLLASLADDYTNTENIIFTYFYKGQTRGFLGMTTPRKVRKILSNQFPDLEIVYREAYKKAIKDYNNEKCLEEKEIEWIIENFGFLLQRQIRREEGELLYIGKKEWVTRELLDTKLDMSPDNQSVVWNEGPVTALLLYKILNCPSRHVALLADNQVKKIVDRFELADRIADYGLKQRLS
jgi:hypothetical protein